MSDGPQERSHGGGEAGGWHHHPPSTIHHPAYLRVVPQQCRGESCGSLESCACGQSTAKDDTAAPLSVIHSALAYGLGKTGRRRTHTQCSPQSRIWRHHQTCAFPAPRTSLHPPHLGLLYYGTLSGTRSDAEVVWCLSSSSRAQAGKKPRTQHGSVG